MIVNPPAPYWGEMNVGDQDTRQRDFGPDLSQIPDTIASVAGVTITRLDGVPMGVQDLTLLSTPTVDTTNLIVEVWLGGNVAGVTYNVNIGIMTVAGRPLSRDAVILVGSSVG